RELMRPGLLMVAASAVFAAILSPIAPAPPTSWYGSLSHGVGILWYVEVCVLGLAAAVAWRLSDIARALIALSAASTILLALVLNATDIEMGGKVLELPLKGDLLAMSSFLA